MRTILGAPFGGRTICGKVAGSESLISDLPQDHLADDVARLDVLGVDRRIAGSACRQAGGELGVVELDPNDKWRRRYLLRRHRSARSEDLTRRGPHQDRIDLALEDLTGE